MAHGELTNPIAPASSFSLGKPGDLFDRIAPLKPPTGGSGCPPTITTQQGLEQLANSMFSMASIPNEAIPAGYTFFGQFVSHDMTFNVSSNGRFKNVRSPVLDLDSLYGRGPQEAPFLYEKEAEYAFSKLETLCPGVDGLCLPVIKK